MQTGARKKKRGGERARKRKHAEAARAHKVSLQRIALDVAATMAQMQQQQRLSVCGRLHLKCTHTHTVTDAIVQSTKRSEAVRLVRAGGGARRRLGS